jgi:hypothetical protein
VFWSRNTELGIGTYWTTEGLDFESRNLKNFFFLTRSRQTLFSSRLFSNGLITYAVGVLMTGKAKGSVNYTTRYNSVRFEVFTTVTMKNGVFWDVTPCGSCKNRHFGGT